MSWIVQIFSSITLIFHQSISKLWQQFKIWEKFEYQTIFSFTSNASKALAFRLLIKVVYEMLWGFRRWVWMRTFWKFWLRVPRRWRQTMHVDIFYSEKGWVNRKAKMRKVMRKGYNLGFSTGSVSEKPSKCFFFFFWWW